MITNKMNLPQPFVDAVTSDHVYKPHRYSVTEVLGGTCEAILKRRHDREITEDVSQRIWALFGSAVHKILQEAEATETQLQENWLSVEAPVDGYELSGIFDLYDDSNGTVTDYKTTSVWTVQFRNFDKWRDQCMLYCWMLQGHGFSAWRGEIVAILRDHNMRKASTDRDYPQHPVFRIGWDFTKDDMQKAEGRLREWFTEVIEQEQRPDSELTPCSYEERWHKDDKWAVKKKGVKRAVRVYSNKQDAYQRAAGENREAKGEPFYVEFREGEDTKCESYCSVAEFCPYYQALMRQREQQD